MRYDEKWNGASAELLSWTFVRAYRIVEIVSVKGEGVCVLILVWSTRTRVEVWSVVENKG